MIQSQGIPCSPRGRAIGPARHFLRSGARMIAAASLMVWALVWTWPALAKVYCDDTTKRYHIEGCPEIESISKWYLRVFDTVPQVEAMNYYPCPKCNPPITQDSMQPVKTKRQLSRPLGRVNTFYGDTTTKTYHLDWCPKLAEVAEGKRVLFRSIDAAWAKDYKACTECHPPVMVEKQELYVAPVEPMSTTPPAAMAPTGNSMMSEPEGGEASPAMP